MAAQRRREVPTETEIHDKVKDLILGIQHAKIECEADKGKQLGQFSKTEDELLNDLESLKIVIKEYEIALKERKIRRRDSFNDRDSGISLDRSSVLSRDSYPVQEMGDASSVLNIHPYDMATASRPIEHNEETDQNERVGQYTDSEKEALRRHGNSSAQRRTHRERKNISSESIPEN